MWGIESTTKEQMICLPSRPQVQIRSDPCCIAGQLLNLENIKDGEKKFFFSGQKSRIHKSEGGELKGDWEGLGVDRFEGTKEEEGGKRRKRQSTKNWAEGKGRQYGSKVQ
jgi:hypothetical protein